MLRWVLALGAATAFVWGLVQVLDALTCVEECGSEIMYGVVGLGAASLGFIYLAILFSRVKQNV